MQLLSEYFSLNDVGCISCIPLSIYKQNDRQIWHYTKNRLYYVKSSYHLLVHLDACSISCFMSLEKVVEFTCATKCKAFYWHSKMSLLAKVINVALGC